MAKPETTTAFEMCDAFDLIKELMREQRIHLNDLVQDGDPTGAGDGALRVARLLSRLSLVLEALWSRDGERGNRDALAIVARELHHTGDDRIMTLETAAYELYGMSKKRSKEDDLYHPEWRHVMLIYEKTKGQPFVFEPEANVLEACGVRDVGPLFTWSALWRFAGCPRVVGKGKNRKRERPTWKPAEGRVGVAFWDGTGGAAYREPRWRVAKFREAQRGATAATERKRASRAAA